MNYSIHQADIEEHVRVIGKRINDDWFQKEEPIVFVCVLNGAFMFFSDLVKHLNFKTEIDFIRIKSYTDKEQEKFVITKNIEIPIENKHVFIIDDIADTGNTMDELISLFKQGNPTSIQTVTLLKRHSSKYTPDYYGAEIHHNEWFYGYGMDLKGYQRNLSDLLVVGK